MKIFICREGEKRNEQLKHMIEKYIFIIGRDAEIAGADTSPKRFLEKVKRAKISFGFYILGTEFVEEMNGFTLTEKLRKLDPRAYIVLLSDSPPNFPESFRQQLEIMDYILETDEKEYPEKLLKAVDTALKRTACLHLKSTAAQTLLIYENGEEICLEQKKIHLIDTDKITHRIEIFTKDRKFSVRGTIKGYAGKLDPSIFCQVSQSTILNMCFVEKADSGQMKLYMKDGKAVEYSHRFQPHIFRFLDALGIKKKK